MHKKYMNLVSEVFDPGPMVWQFTAEMTVARNHGKRVVLNSFNNTLQLYCQTYCFTLFISCLPNVSWHCKCKCSKIKKNKKICIITGCHLVIFVVMFASSYIWLLRHKRQQLWISSVVRLVNDDTIVVRNTVQQHNSSNVQLFGGGSPQTSW